MTAPARKAQNPKGSALAGLRPARRDVRAEKLDAVCAAIARNAVRLCGAEFCNVEA